MIRKAKISECGKYRYNLKRIWDKEKPNRLFVMLNPSKADDQEDDPTIRKCIAIAKTHGYGSITVVNLFAWRATKSKDLNNVPINELVGTYNFKHWLKAIENSDAIVLGWGNNLPKDYYHETKELLKYYRVFLKKKDIKCLDINTTGHPKHPLFCRNDSPLKAYKI